MKRNSRRSTSSAARPVNVPGERLVLGIDPGTRITGYAVVRQTDAGHHLVCAGVILNDPSRPLSSRLRHIHDEIGAIVTAYRPSEFAIETAFTGRNAQSALKLGQARGVSLLAAEQHDLAIAEYSPREIKKAVTGNGNASKEQVRYMVTSLLSLSAKALRLDASDAAATALCHLHRGNSRRNRHPSWESFVNAHPERVKP
jgi:crossover junction endodeoxyribonuclease RuvC